MTTLTFDKILYAIDINGNCKEALQEVTRFAEKHGAKLWIIYAMVSPFTSYAYAGIYMRATEIEEELVADATHKMEKLLKPYPHVEHEVVLGEPTMAILDYAAKHQSDCIILNGHKHNVFGQLGSVADRVMNHANCNVLVMRHKK